MRTRRSWRNQNRLFELLFKPERLKKKPVQKVSRPVKKPVIRRGPVLPVVRPDYLPHYHQDDSGIFECPIGSACQYRVKEAAGFEAPTASALAEAEKNGTVSR